MKVKLDVLQVSRLLVTGVCVVGFVYQVSKFTDDYFKYATESELSLSMPVDITAPDLTVCFRYVDIVDVASLNSKLASTGKRNKLKSLEKLKKGDNFTAISDDIIEACTINDIFKFTPQSGEILFRCSVKKTTDYDFYVFEGDKCKKRFLVFKFYLQEYICFRFKRVLELEKSAPSTFSYHSISYALDRPGDVSIIVICCNFHFTRAPPELSLILFSFIHALFLVFLFSSRLHLIAFEIISFFSTQVCCIRLRSKTSS